jgi:hypothetical protein
VSKSINWAPWAEPERRKISEGMKRYWARRKREEQQKRDEAKRRRDERPPEA